MSGMYGLRGRAVMGALFIMSLAVLVRGQAPPVDASDDSWDDFANNLATDLAPFLILFGEQVTMQYLSESTKTYDYFMFAIAPIGIITTLVSVIRVCGNAALRAFIGRGHEAPTQAEVELCSSTGGDVCELYNGVVVRLFGRPKLLEVVYSKDVPGAEKHEAVFTIDRLKELGFIKTSDVTTNTNERAIKYTPNLSLNAGFLPCSSFQAWAIIAIGGFLQMGVFTLAALATYRWKWKKGDQLVDPWAVYIMISGTMTLSAGVFFSAYLIGETTTETTYERASEQAPSIYWLQPGDQNLADQVFGSFAYSKRFHSYVRSWKSKGERPMAVNFTAACTIAGFGLQFFGLRSLHSSVTIAQILLSLSMCVVRSLLRTTRLKPHENLLHAQQDVAPGSELDWLANQMVQDAAERSSEPVAESVAPQLDLFDEHYFQMPAAGHYLTSHCDISLLYGMTFMLLRPDQTSPEPARPPTSTPSAAMQKYSIPDLNQFVSRFFKLNLWPQSKPEPQRNSSQPTFRPFHPNNYISMYMEEPSAETERCSRIDGTGSLYDTLYARYHLAGLTRNYVGGTSGSYELVDDMVTVRNRSRDLCTALEETLSTFAALHRSGRIETPIWPSECGPAQAFRWNFRCCTGSTLWSTSIEDYCDVRLVFLPKGNGWKLQNPKILEAVLGLWLWSLINERKGITHGHANDLQNAVVTAYERTSAECVGAFLPQSLHAPSREPKCVRLNQRAAPDQAYRDTMFFGLRLRTDDWATSIAQDPKAEVFFEPTKTPLESLCVQACVGFFVEALGKALEPKTEHLKPVRLEITNQVRVAHELVDGLVDVFVTSHVGTFDEAVRCLVPRLFPTLQFSLFPAIDKQAREMVSVLCKEQRWQEAEDIVQWAWDICLRTVAGSCEGPLVPSRSGRLILRYTALWAVEFNRIRCITLTSGSKLEHLTVSFKPALDALHTRYMNLSMHFPTGEQEALKELLFRYAKLELFPHGTWEPGEDLPKQTGYQALRWLTKRGHLFKGEKNYVGDLWSLLRAATASDIPELVFSVLNTMSLFSPDVNLQDSDGRSVLWHAANSGASDTVEMLLYLGADADLADNEGLTPLAVSVGKGNLKPIDMLRPSTDQLQWLLSKHARAISNVRFIVTQGKKEEKKLILGDCDMTHAMEYALTHGDVEMAMGLFTITDEPWSTWINQFIRQPKLILSILSIERRAAVICHPSPTNQRPPLAKAASIGAVEATQILLEHGAEIVSRDGRFNLERGVKPFFPAGEWESWLEKWKQAGWKRKEWRRTGDDDDLTLVEVTGRPSELDASLVGYSPMDSLLKDG